ncbi:MAG: hypothetical protein IT381_22035 [Deltaproteobacteria bacterium]|nr:hypothetical protein [Deltaproteobacteria bacterium]
MRKPSKPERKVVRAVRSPHGTRVMKSIVCSSCKKTDYISFVPKDGAPLLCQSCAEKSLNIVSEDRDLSADKYEPCERCGKPYPAGPKRKPKPGSKEAERDKDAQLLVPRDNRKLCGDCRLAFAAERRQAAQKARGGKPIVIKAKHKQGARE